MRIFLYTILLLVGVVLLALTVGFFLPSRLRVSEQVVIDQSPSAVYEVLNDVTLFNNFSPWYEIDSTTTYTYSETTQGVGSFMEWDSEELGVGTYTITSTTPVERVSIALSFGEGDPAESWYDITDTPEGTQVEWGFDSELGWPFGRFFGLFYRSTLEQQYAQGLALLQGYFENNALDVTFEEVQQEALPVMGVRISYDPGLGDGMMDDAFGQVIDYTARNEINLETARIVAVYFSAIAEVPQDLLAGVVSDQSDTKPNSNIEPYTIPAGAYVRTTHRGDYSTLSNTHQAIIDYISTQEDRQLAGDVFEDYVTDPEVVLDTAAWVTHIYYRVEALDPIEALDSIEE